MDKLIIKSKIHTLNLDLSRVSNKLIGAYSILNECLEPLTPAYDKAKDIIDEWNKQFIDISNQISELQLELKKYED